MNLPIRVVPFLGDCLISIQQSFPHEVRQADLVLRYDSPPRPLVTLAVRVGEVEGRGPIANAQLVPATKMILSQFVRQHLRPRASDTILSMARPVGATGTVRVNVVDRQGRSHPVYGLGHALYRAPDGTPEIAKLPDRSNWFLHSVRPEDGAKIEVSTATESSVVFRAVQLHPRS